MVRRTQRGAGGHKQGSQSDGHALLWVDDVVRGRVAIGGDGLLVEKVTWWPALGRTQSACANLSYILFLPHRNGPCRLGYGSARYAAELFAGSVEGFLASVTWVKRKSYRSKESTGHGMDDQVTVKSEKDVFEARRREATRSDNGSLVSRSALAISDWTLQTRKCDRLGNWVSKAR